MPAVREPRGLDRVKRRLGNTTARTRTQVEHADLEVASIPHRKSNLVGVATAPIRLRAVAADPAGHTHRSATAHRHHVELGSGFACVHEPRAIGREAGGGFHCIGTGAPRDHLPLRIADIDFGVALPTEGHRHLLSVRAVACPTVGALQADKTGPLKAPEINPKDIGEPRFVETRIEQVSAIW